MHSREFTLRAPGLKTLLVIAVLMQIVSSLVISTAAAVAVAVTVWLGGGVASDVRSLGEAQIQAKNKAEIIDLKVQQALIALAKMDYMTMTEGAIGLNVPPPPGRPAVAKEN